MTYCVNIIENEKRRISKIGKEVEEIIQAEKNSVLSEKIINKLRDISNLKNCDYAPPKSVNYKIFAFFIKNTIFT